MAVQVFNGPLKAGTTKSGSGLNLGFAGLVQTGTIAQNSTNAVSLTFKLPANAQILDFLVDTLTAFDSAVSAILTIGTAAAGTQYVTSVDVKSDGRAAITHTAAQLLAMASIGSNLSVVATVTPSGATAAGLVRVTVRYAQK